MATTEKPESWQACPECGVVRAKPSQEAPSAAEPCPTCGLRQNWGPHKHPMAPVLEPDSPLESTDPAIPSSWQSDPTGIPVFRVEPGCECVPREPGLKRVTPWVWWLYCQKCDVLWSRVLTVAPDVAASPSAST